MNDTTHNGKIGRLPKPIRDELNHRLDDGEPGERILEWLNGLPRVEHVLAKDFGGGRINAQNLSNWRKGGHQGWLKQQERLNLVRELTENGEELATEAGGMELGNHLSAVLLAELAASARDALATIMDPAERCFRQQEYLETVTRVRRQDYLAGQLAIARERRARARAEEKSWDDFSRESAPLRLAFRHSYMGDLFASPDFTSQTIATHEAESLLRTSNLNPPAPPAPSRRKSPNQTESR